MKFSINSIALSNIKNRKKQYIVLFVGIALSIYFTATALLFGYSMYASIEELSSTRAGDQNVIVNNCRDISFETLKENGVFSEYGYSKTLVAILPTGEIEGGGFNVSSFDETTLRLSGKRLIAGDFPQNEGEIALEQSAVARLRENDIDIDLGDTVELTILASGLETSPEDQYTTVKKYTLVGILKDQSKYQEFAYHAQSIDFSRLPSGIFSSSEQAEPGSLPHVKCYAKMTVNEDNKISVEKFLDDNGVFSAGYYRAVYSDSIAAYVEGSNEITELMTFCIVIAVVLVLASCVGVANSFTSVLDVKKQQIGLLRAVGATKKQIKSIFGRESVIIALISTPVALIMACLTAFAITGMLGEDFIFNLNILILILVTGFGFLSVMLACALPLKRASDIPPMQAIRKADLSRKLKNKKIKSKDVFDVAGLIANRNITLYKSKMLGISVMLIIAVAFFFITNSFIIPAVVGLNDDQFTADGEYSITVDASGVGTYILKYFHPWIVQQAYHAPWITEQDKREVESLSGVSKVFGVKNLHMKILTDRISPYISQGDKYDLFSYLSPTIPEMWLGPVLTDDDTNEDYSLYLLSKEQYGYDKDYLSVSMTGIDEELLAIFEPFVIEGRIDIEKLNSGEEVLLIAPKEYAYSYEIFAGGTAISIQYKYHDFTTGDEVFQNDMFFVGDEIDLSLLYIDSVIETIEDADGNLLMELPEDAVRIDNKVKIGAILTLQLPGLNGKELNAYGGRFIMDLGDLITTNKGFDALGYDIAYKNLLIHTDQSLDAEATEYLESRLTEIANRTTDAMMLSYISAANELRETYFRIFIAVMAVLILLFIICVSMLNNALSARIRSAKREIGTLRAVGASRAVVKKSYFWQLLSMFGLGSALGILIGIALRAIMINVMDINLDGVDAYPLPIWQSLLFILLMFGICHISINNKVNMILKHNVVENIREL